MSLLTNSSRRKLLHFTLCEHPNLAVSSLLGWIEGELSCWTPAGPAACQCRVLMGAPHRAAPLGPWLRHPKSRWPEACTQGEEGEGKDNWQPHPSPHRPQTRAQMDMLETCQRFCEGHAGTQSQLISELIKRDRRRSEEQKVVSALPKGWLASGGPALLSCGCSARCLLGRFWLLFGDAQASFIVSEVFSCLDLKTKQNKACISMYFLFLSCFLPRMSLEPDAGARSAAKLR